ncbi:MAG: leucine--tRNA ligase [Candidatus Doudnabacteria bacterium]|nr:leucine--tRNA ligase [Candidatus Doudnabacteria bacterium]
MQGYNHKTIEKQWQQEWDKQKLYQTPDQVKGKKNYYVLVEFPYPSGNLHIGHWYAFAVPDIFARKKRMEGYNVLFPIGFDSFGLPAENAAIKHGINPKKWTYDNIAWMTDQIKSMGASFDWSRRIAASDPDYYKWTQWLFLKLYEKGLAYRGKAIVNWDPVDKTVLANEQVLPDGTAERSGAKVEKRELEQWFFKITDYAERLLADLDDLKWPEQIKDQQRNWIGRSEGALLKFPISNFQFPIEVFTTRPDTLFGATYMVLAPEHPLIANLESQISNWKEVEQYIEKTKSKTELQRTALEKDKTGVELKGVKAINPATKEKIPIWIADYVLMSYGTGAIMAVPAHDERDFAFAKKFKLPIRKVIKPPQLTGSGLVTDATSGIWGVVPGQNELEADVWVGEGTLVNSSDFDGLNTVEARNEITAKFGKPKIQYKLRDWLISRQRYWGAPIPIVYDPQGQPHPIPEKHLPWLLPEEVDFTPTGEPPLGKSKELKARTEKIFGKGWRSEYDTMDTFVDSSWYFLRYLDSQNDKEFSLLEKQKLWMPIDRYSGGAEHTTMHVLYSRFFYKALFDLDLATHKEPYVQRFNRGIILGEDGRKMSKRWGNVVDPDKQVAEVGADSVRMYLAFIGPYNEAGAYPWSTKGLIGMRRFLDKVFRFSSFSPSPLTGEGGRRPDEGGSSIHKLIKRITSDIEAFKFNTAIAAFMEFLNENKQMSKENWEDFLRLLAPFAPHLTEELWRQLGHKTSIHKEPWPKFDPKLVKEETVTIAVQVSGKLRGTIIVDAGTSEDKVKQKALAEANVKRHLEGKKITKVIFVKDKLINFVVK